MIAQRDIPKIILIHALLIIALGLTALYSASYNNFRIGQEVVYDQLGAAAFALVVMMALSYTDYRKFYDIAYPVYALSVVFLILVLFLGRAALGATRWFSVGGISFQPSEFSKLAVILLLARYFSQRRPRLSFNITTSLSGLMGDFIIPLALTGISVLLIFKQPDLGTAILIFGIFFIMLFNSGIDMRVFIGLVVGLLSFIPFAWHILKPYQQSRILVFLNPNHDPTGAGYTIIQSKIALGSGQWWGKGWLSGSQNQLNFLPERHTDFIFSVIGEEWGFLGSVFMVYCYAVIIYCAFLVANNNKDRFGQAVTIGIIGIFAMQVVINIGMVMGMFPVVGITLPMVSYGRTSFLVFAIMLGFLLNLSKKRTMF